MFDGILFRSQNLCLLLVFYDNVVNVGTGQCECEHGIGEHSRHCTEK